MAGLPAVADPRERDRWRPPAARPAALLTLAIAGLYAMVGTGLLSVGRADIGELGILGLAGAVHVVLTVLLWWRPTPALLIGHLLLQGALAAMYVAIAPERQPQYELWGLTIRALSAVLAVTLLAALAQSVTHRRNSAR